MTAPSTLDRRGLAFSIGAYAIWGVLPLYFHILTGVPALQVLAHRVVWSVLLLILLVLALKRGGAVLAAARGKTLLLLVASAGLIAVNWLVYIWAVQHGHVLEASLGYFINPLVNVALGMAVLGERLRKWQGVAIAIAGLGVAAMALSGGGSVWISLVLAISFGLYGLLRKIAAIDALGGLTVETVLLAPICIAWLLYCAQSDATGFGQSLALDLLILSAGVLTSVPLLMFAAAARRLPLSTLGLMQYLSPSMQFGIALLLGEPLRPVHFIAFPLIWAGCALYAWDSVRATRAPLPEDIKPIG